MKTEKQKMLDYGLYDANNDAALLAERLKAKELCYDFTHSRPPETEKQIKIMRGLLGKTPQQFYITPPFWCDYGYNIELGDNFYANHNLMILDGAKVCFGDNVFIAPCCGFYTVGHPIDALRRNQGLEYAHPITVGSNVWFGGGVKVMPGVTIGSNVVIAAGSVVTKNILDNVIAGGVPCRVLRGITGQDQTNPHQYYPPQTAFKG